MGLREFVYILEDGVIVDVQYNDQGIYNGSIASELQSEAAEKAKKKKK
ncbi:MAG: hypothetical protein AAF385_11525 [Pseudomonadota bacterium]